MGRKSEPVTAARLSQLTSNYTDPHNRKNRPNLNTGIDIFNFYFYIFIDFRQTQPSMNKSQFFI